MTAILTEDDVRQLLRDAIGESSHMDWCHKHRVNPSHLSLVLGGYRGPGPAILNALGVVKAYALKFPSRSRAPDRTGARIVMPDTVADRIEPDAKVMLDEYAAGSPIGLSIEGESSIFLASIAISMRRIAGAMERCGPNPFAFDEIPF